jgi:hypothetical protein
MSELKLLIIEDYLQIAELINFIDNFNKPAESR